MLRDLRAFVTSVAEAEQLLLARHESAEKVSPSNRRAAVNDQCVLAKK